MHNMNFLLLRRPKVKPRMFENFEEADSISNYCTVLYVDTGDYSCERWYRYLFLIL